MSSTGLVSIARIVKSQGNKGEVAADLLTDCPQRFHRIKEVFLQKDGQRPFRLTLETFRPHKQRIALKFSGIDDIGAAEHLRGHDVRIAKEDLLALPAGSYYRFDLIDCIAKDTRGHPLGRVTDVLEIGSHFLLSLRKGNKELLVPFAREIVLTVDVANKEMICDLPEGLEECCTT